MKGYTSLSEQLRELLRINAEKAESAVGPVIKVPVAVVKEPVRSKAVKQSVSQLPANTENLGWNHTVFKTAEGVFYAVSQRAIDIGYVPPNGTTKATDAEWYEFYKNMVIRNSPPITNENRNEVAKKMKDLHISPSIIKTLTGIDITEADTD